MLRAMLINEHIPGHTKFLSLLRNPLLNKPNSMHARDDGSWNAAAQLSLGHAPISITSMENAQPVCSFKLTACPYEQPVGWRWDHNAHVHCIIGRSILLLAFSLFAIHYMLPGYRPFWRVAVMMLTLDESPSNNSEPLTDHNFLRACSERWA